MRTWLPRSAGSVGELPAASLAVFWSEHGSPAPRQARFFPYVKHHTALQIPRELKLADVI